MKYVWIIFLFLLAVRCDEQDDIRLATVPEIPVDMAFVYNCDIDKMIITSFDPQNPHIPSPATIKFHYNPDNSLARITNAIQLDYDLCFEYDALNRLVRVGSCGADGIDHVECVIEYPGSSKKIGKFHYPGLYEYNGSYNEVTYDEEDRITTIREHITKPPEPVTHFKSWVYTYDDNDNLIKIEKFRVAYKTYDSISEMVTEYIYDETLERLAFYPEDYFDEAQFLIFRFNIPGRNFRLLKTEPGSNAEYQFDDQHRVIFIDISRTDGSFEQAEIFYK